MRYAVKRVLKVDRTPLECETCGKICLGKRSLKSHMTQMHSGKKDTSNRGRPVGIPAWNKGLRSKKDTRNPDYVGKHGGYRANAGRSQKHKVEDSFGKVTTLQSSYELRCSEVLNAMGIKWYRPKALQYDGRNYFPDFYLPEFDVYLDPKNDYKAKLDEEKIAKVIAQNGVKLFVLLNKQITEEHISRII